MKDAREILKDAGFEIDPDKSLIITLESGKQVDLIKLIDRVIEDAFEAGTDAMRY